MGECESCQRNNNNNIFGEKPIELSKKEKLKYMENYICKVIGDKIVGTGFFFKVKGITELIPVLITNYHIINDEYLGKNNFLKVYIKGNYQLIKINKESKLYSSERDKYDIMIIKLNDDKDAINNYLEIERKIFENDSLLTYKKEDIYILHHPKSMSGKACISYGKGIELINKYDIKHFCYTDIGSSGGPIISLSTNKVIGIHKGFIDNGAKSFNIGTFLKFPLDELDSKIKKNFLENNHIIAVINIKFEDINKDIRIINSYEENMTTKSTNSCLKKDYLDENEIKKCLIEINGKPISFNYYHKFKKKGNYTIKYSFMNYLTRINHMFCECSSIISINLSNFNTKNVINMSCIFARCSSLTNVNLTNINTQNVKNMYGLFIKCRSLTSINLSNFNTRNVTNMMMMFKECSSLTNIDLSRFSTRNVENKKLMFIGCTSLKPENIKIYSPSARQELMQQFMLDMYLYNQFNDCNYAQEIFQS